MQECTASFDFSNVITWALVVFGWLVVYRQNRAFQDRKELRAALDKIIIDIDSLREMAVSYHTVESEANSLLSNKIKSLTQSISANISGTALGSPDVLEKIKQTRQSITFENFETTEYEPQRHNSGLVLEIFGSTDDLKDSLETRYTDLYKRTLRYKFLCLVKRSPQLDSGPT
ncbi:hypothetical protein [Vreelandella venusta]|uniref:hypothetical protein n=1 Tax=Vreelandella venusta TaxID=44935 RepID=UPI0018DAB35F|nr:hypothetical protein [Halomonas venusta]QPI65952.1 hypothetical protein IR195_09745 [Halomonas venusta]